MRPRYRSSLAAARLRRFRIFAAHNTHYDTPKGALQPSTSEDEMAAAAFEEVGLFHTNNKSRLVGQLRFLGHYFFSRLFDGRSHGLYFCARKARKKESSASP